MYPTLLFAHSVVRWLVLFSAAWAAMAALSGARSRRAWTRKARVPGIVLASVVDVQLLLGLSLWLGVSPYAVTGAARSHYWTFAHPLAGIAVVALVHVGSARSRRMLDDAYRWQPASRFYLAALVVTVLAIPWPLLGMGRSLLPY